MKILTSIFLIAELLFVAGWIVTRFVDNTHTGRTKPVTITEAVNKSNLACKVDLTALNGEQRNRHKTVMQQVMSKIQEIKELSNGYALRLPPGPVMIQAAAEFISLEQKCCGFFGLNLDVKPNNGPLWLSLTGGPGSKEFLQAELGMNR